MNKEKLLRNYVTLSIVAGIYFLLAAFLYKNAFGSEVHGIVVKTLFNVTVQNSGGDIVVFNTPLLAFLIFTVFNIAVFVLLGIKKDVEQPLLKSVALYNAALTLVLIMGQLVLVYMIPANINGAIVERFVYTQFPYTNDIVYNAVNINYVVALIYVVFNMYVSIKTLPPHSPSEKAAYHDVELEEDKLLRQFTKDE